MEARRASSSCIRVSAKKSRLGNSTSLQRLYSCPLCSKTNSDRAMLLSRLPEYWSCDHCERIMRRLPLQLLPYCELSAWMHVLGHGCDDHISRSHAALPSSATMSRRFLGRTEAPTSSEERRVKGRAALPMSPAKAMSVCAAPMGAVACAQAL